jgi:hypothetical protein
MTKLGHTFSSLIAVDSHALRTVTGGAPKTPKPPGKLKRGLALGGFLGGIILGPQAPGLEDLPPGELPSPPRPRPVAGGPLVPGPSKLGPLGPLGTLSHIG